VTGQSATPSTRLRVLLAERRAEILALAETYGATNVRVFGSVARGEDGPESDIDLLVDFPAAKSLFKVAGLELAFRDLLGVPVDCGPADLLKADMRERVLAEAVEL
jgi:predicted nucleotidyltransferase